MKPTKTFLITGATAGIGRHAALHLARRGHRVIATGRNEAALAELEREAVGLPLETLRLDVTDDASVAAAATEALRRTGGAGVDVLVNNAGYGKVGPLEEVPDAEMRGQYETNVFGLMRVTRAFLPQLKARRGRLVNVSSVGGHVTFPFMGAYNSTKYAVESLSDALRAELAPFGVRVVLVEPGPIRSEFNNTFLKEIQQYRRPESPYAPVLARVDQMRSRFEQMSAGPEVVSRAIEKAGLRRRPAARYVVPLSSAIFLRFLKLLPTRLSDALMRAAMGIPGAGRVAQVTPPAPPPRELPAAQ